MIIHDKERHRFQLDEAYTEYEIRDSKLIILHTFVPESMTGRGIAGLLVQEAFSWASSHELHPAAVCTYAAAWMKRHNVK